MPTGICSLSILYPGWPPKASMDGNWPLNGLIPPKKGLPPPAGQPSQTLFPSGPMRNWIRYTMNGFVIAIGSYVEALTKKANEVATTIGKVHVDVGGTACKVPLATEYIKKIEKQLAVSSCDPHQVSLSFSLSSSPSLFPASTSYISRISSRLLSISHALSLSCRAWSFSDIRIFSSC